MIGKAVSAGFVAAAIALGTSTGAGAANCEPSLGNIPSSQCPNSPEQKLKDAGPKTQSTLDDAGAKSKDKVKQARPKTVRSVTCFSGRVGVGNGKCL